MRRRTLLALLAFVAGLAVGAAAFLEPGRLAPEQADGPTPRLATGGVSLEVTNRGNQPADATVEVRDRSGTLVFQSSFPIVPAGTGTRNIVSLLEGEYEAKVLVGGAVGSGLFRTTDCGGRVYLSFEVVADGSGTRASSPARRCA